MNNSELNTFVYKEIKEKTERLMQKKEKKTKRNKIEGNPYGFPLLQREGNIHFNRTPCTLLPFWRLLTFYSFNIFLLVIWYRL